MPGNWFVALAVPGDSWFTRVPEPPPGVRLFHPADLHITVAFLGACGQQAAEAAFEIAPRWPTGALDVTLGPVEAMGNPRRPSAFASIVRESSDVLRGAILVVRDEMISRAGARLDDRQPNPHVTIARPRRKADGSERRHAAEWARSVRIREPRVQLKRLVLYTHSVDRTERLFQEHAEHELH